jgi:two-component sensor histidine kinase
VLLALLYGRFLAEPVSALRRVAVSFARREPVRAIRTGIQELDGVAKGLAEASDILKQRDQVQESLINELNHRVKNTLATIQSIARQTRRRASSLDEFGQAFEGRLMALAKSHDTLTRSGWAGGDLQNIVLESCRPFSDPSRLVLNGPQVEIPNRVVVGIGMVLHELATNAAKYGAFAASNGTVRIEWRLEPGEPHGNLRLRWKERDGPPVVPINKKGFGSTLIVSIVESDLSGKAEMVFEPDGLRFDLAIPLLSELEPPIDLAGNGASASKAAAE